VAGLKSQLAEGAKLTVIDVRPNALFVQGHIPGAINIPAALCPLKNLPPLGKVVVCGAGLGRDEVENAAAKALAGKSGLSVEVLDGGYAAWESSQGVTTAKRGLKPDSANYVSYAQLKAAKADGVVLVDLRHPSAEQPLTDLAQVFPGFQITQAAPSVKAQGQSTGSAAPLFVLIDNGDGSAMETARTLQAGGTKRFAILAGGEIILARQGQVGLQRVSFKNHATTTMPPTGAAK
jgi:rhodanese-related sulfurtransferase